jgi:hypothetical protein
MATIRRMDCQRVDDLIIARRQSMLGPGSGCRHDEDTERPFFGRMQRLAAMTPSLGADRTPAGPHPRRLGKTAQSPLGGGFHDPGRDAAGLLVA